MDIDHRYEAWRNLILILAGILIGYSFDSFKSIRDGVLSLTVFDKAFPQTTWPSLLSVLVIIYVAKNAHGILITLYDRHYEEKLKESLFRATCSWFLTALLIISFALVCKLSELVDDGQTLDDRCFRLMAFTLFPNIVLLLFDVFHIRAFEYAFGGGIRGFFLAIRRELLMCPLHRTNHDNYKIVWIAENIISILALFLWLLMFYFSNNPPFKIEITLYFLGSLLFLNSVGDYILNCRYFFFGKNNLFKTKQ